MGAHCLLSCVIFFVSLVFKGPLWHLPGAGIGKSRTWRTLDPHFHWSLLCVCSGNQSSREASSRSFRKKIVLKCHKGHQSHCRRRAMSCMRVPMRMDSTAPDCKRVHSRPLSPSRSVVHAGARAHGLHRLRLQASALTPIVAVSQYRSFGSPYASLTIIYFFIEFLPLCGLDRYIFFFFMRMYVYDISLTFSLSLY